MKRKLICLFILLLIVISFAKLSYASETGRVYLETNKEIIEKGEEIEITVNLKDVKTTAFSFSLYFDELKLEYISNIENTNVIDNRIIYVWHDVSGGINAKQGELAKFKFKAKENGTVNFSIQGEFFNNNGGLIETNFETKQIQIGKEETILERQASEEQGIDSRTSNANLQALRLNIEGITPSFQNNIYEYYLTVQNNINEIEVLAISENPNANVEISGNTKLKDGLNFINIVVTSEDKTTKNTYIIQVTKTTNLELANNNLETLAIENTLLYPPFDMTNTNYKVEISNKLDNINILAIPQNEKAVVKITGKDNLKQGSNLVTIVVTAPNRF